MQIRDGSYWVAKLLQRAKSTRFQQSLVPSASVTFMNLAMLGKKRHCYATEFLVST
ncbi:hypothetical protein WN48_04741 [Eufriesea mexicana]|nr:hypothetical protein WN48_04741 [Eufriesea mexicana]